MPFLWEPLFFPVPCPSGKAFPVDVVQTTSKDFEGMRAYNLTPYPDVKASSIMSTTIPCYAVPLGTSVPSRFLPLLGRLSPLMWYRLPQSDFEGMGAYILPPYPNEGKQHHVNDHSLLFRSSGTSTPFRSLPPLGRLSPLM